MTEPAFPAQSPPPPEMSPDEERDVELMRRIAASDALAFEELMARHQRKVESLLLHFVGNRELAEDLTQEVFLKVYKARNTYQPIAKFSTWLFRIVHNAALNALRSKKRHPEMLFTAAGKDSDQSGAVSLEENLLAKSGLIPTRLVDKKEMQEVVQKGLNSLSEPQRCALLLHRFEGMNYKQIAEVMDITPQAVKSLLCRARLVLRERLAPYFEEGRLSE